MLALSLLTLGMVAVATAGVVPEMIETRNAKGETIHLPLAPASMTGPIQLGGPNMTFTGQHFEIEAEIAKLNPYWSNMTEAELDLLEPARDLTQVLPRVRLTLYRPVPTVLHTGARMVSLMPTSPAP